jgi:hypothetical protein
VDSGVAIERERKYHHEAHEDHEGRNFFRFRHPAFVTFVIRGWQVFFQLMQKFAQAAKTFKDDSTKMTKDEA